VLIHEAISHLLDDGEVLAMLNRGGLPGAR
jgi:hypothetical protein